MSQVKRFTRKIGRGGRYDSLTAIKTETLSSGDTLAEVEAFMSRFCGDNDIERMESLARDILEKSGLPTTLICGDIMITELLKGRELTPEYHAAHILFFAHATRQYIDTGDSKSAVWAAMRLQHQADQLLIRAIELPARIGMKLEANASHPKHSPKIKQSWTSMAAAIKALHPEKSARNIAAIVAQRLGVPGATIRAHLKTRAKG